MNALYKAHLALPRWLLLAFSPLAYFAVLSFKPDICCFHTPPQNLKAPSCSLACKSVLLSSLVLSVSLLWLAVPSW